MPFSNVLQLYIPSLFPLEAFEEFVNTVRTVTASDSEARREFNGASNLIGWRFRACVEDKEGYMASWRLYDSDVSFDAIYHRERLLFGIFVSGVSCIEAAVYACYALAIDPNVFNLPFGEKARIYNSKPKSLLKQLKSINQSLVLVSVLQKLIDSKNWKLWKDFRNTMIHRSNLPRNIYGAIGGPLPPTNPFEFVKTWSSEAWSGNEDRFDELIFWLADSLKEILKGGVKLAHKS